MTDPVSTMREIKKVKRENKRNLFQTEVIMQEHSEEGTFKQRPMSHTKSQGKVF